MSASPAIKQRLPQLLPGLLEARTPPPTCSSMSVALWMAQVRGHGREPCRLAGARLSQKGGHGEATSGRGGAVLGSLGACPLRSITSTWPGPSF